VRLHFQRRRDVYVVGNLLPYYEEGNRTALVAPDVFVVFGVPNHVRRTYLLWQAGKAPDFVLEVTSESTWRTDQGRKRAVCERLGVSEYWQYDPTADYLDPPLQGLMLSGAQYGPALPLERADSVESAYSPVLGLNLRLDEGVLQFHGPLTDTYLLSHQESELARRDTEDRLRQAEQARQEAELARLAEARARQEAEARLAKLEARLRALRQSPPPGRPE
jgi:hypothetical protein